MPNPSTPTGIITAGQFEQYATQWLSLVNAPTGDALAACFQTSGERILFAHFSMQQITRLLSTVGVQSIKARFLAVPTEPGPTSRFAIALFAADKQNNRLSTYYLSEGNSTITPTPPKTDGGIPTELATVWLKKWAEATQIAPAMFTTAAGPLQGYNFELKDFIDPLLNGQPFDNLELHLSFGLHEYYPATPGDSLTQTFGLLLRVSDSQQANGGAYYDMMTPCPPGN